MPVGYLVQTSEWHLILDKVHQSPHTTRTKSVAVKQRLVSECCDVLPFHGNLSQRSPLSPALLLSQLMVIAESLLEMTIQPVFLKSCILGGILKKWTLRQGFSHSNL